MPRNISFCYTDYLKHIKFIEHKEGMWRSMKTKYGIIFGTILLIGPYYKPDEYNELRPGYWYHYINGRDVMLLNKEKLLSL